MISPLSWKEILKWNEKAYIKLNHLKLPISKQFLTYKMATFYHSNLKKQILEHLQ